MYIFGGYNPLKEQHYNDLYEFDPQTNNWKQLHPLGEGPCRRRRQACVVVGDRVYLFGGTRYVRLFSYYIYTQGCCFNQFSYQKHTNKDLY